MEVGGTPIIIIEAFRAEFKQPGKLLLLLWAVHGNHYELKCYEI